MVRVDTPVEHYAPPLPDARAINRVDAAAARAPPASRMTSAKARGSRFQLHSGRRASGFLQVSLSKVTRQLRLACPIIVRRVTSDER
jgi:hypothetical protein